MRNLIIFMFITFSYESISASFDCDNARTKIEKAICAYNDVSDLDDKLDWHYKKLYKYKTQKDKSRFRHEQLVWLKERDRSCEESKNIQSCLQKEYNQRIVAIKEKNKYLLVNIAYNESEALNFLIESKRFPTLDSDSLEYFVVSDEEFIISIDWGQAGRLSHGLYYLNPVKKILKRIVAGYPYFDGIYKDKNRTVIVVTSHSERDGLGWQQITAIEIYNGNISENKVATVDYYAGDGEYNDQCYDSSSEHKGRLDIVGHIESIAINDIDSDGYRDVSVVIKSTDCNTLKNSTKTFTFKSKK